MRLTCPCCYGQFELEASLNADAARSALVTALRMPAPLAVLLGNYLACFRPRARALTPERSERLMSELLPMLEAEEVVRDGFRRACPTPLWQQALADVLDARAAGKLTLPLKTHGYLLEIAAALAERAGSKAERARTAARSSASSSGPSPVAPPEDPLVTATRYADQMVDLGAWDQAQRDAYIDEKRQKLGAES
jgi:hypothetical protein